jgi:spore coat protein SA
MPLIYHLLDEAEVFSEYYGGAISRWAANVLREGEEVIVCPSYDNTWKFPSSRIYKLPNWSRTDPIHPVLYRLPWAIQRPVYLRVFKPLLDRVRPGDVVYVHNKPVCAAALATVSRLRGFSLVLHMHNSLLLRTSRIQRFVMHRTPISFCSRFLLNEFRSFWKDHDGLTTVVYNGADDARFHVSNRNANPQPVVVFTGRLVHYKGVHILLQAMKILRERGVNLVCNIAGGARFGSDRDTPYVRMLRKLAPPNVAFLGYQAGEDLAAVLRGADIFCCPSIWNDPFPLSVVEAMACGLPVVASCTGGIPEALAHGGGILVPPGDPEMLANQLELLAKNSTLRDRMGEEALNSFQRHFRWTSSRHQYLNFIASVREDSHAHVAASV